MLRHRRNQPPGYTKAALDEIDDKQAEFVALLKAHWMTDQKSGWMTDKVLARPAAPPPPCRAGRSRRHASRASIFNLRAHRMRPPWLRRLQVHTTFAHFRDMVESRGGSRWWNTNFAENAHIIAVKQPYRSGNKQAVNLQGQIASNYERKRITGEAARQLGVHQGQVRCHVAPPPVTCAAHAARTGEARP